jgi:hypothetical protein
MWRSLIIALVLAAALGGVAVQAAQAQEMDTCYDTRFGSMGCVRVEEFNFADPVLRENSRHLMRGTYIVVSDVTMEMREVPANSMPRTANTWFPGTGR